MKSPLERHSRDISPIPGIRTLPDFGFQFFFRNLGSFRWPFIAVTLASVASTAAKFFTVYLLGDVISRFQSVTADELLLYYLPLWIAADIVVEVLDYGLRRYGEALPWLYGDVLMLRFLRTLHCARPERLFNVGKERIALLVGRYTGHVRGFLDDWVWGSSSRLTKLVIVLVILAAQSWWVLGFNLLFWGLFLLFSWRLSSAFSQIARSYTEQSVETGSTLSSFMLGVASLRRLGGLEFAMGRLLVMTAKSWDRLGEVRGFHARRWFIQLNMFNLFYLGTLTFGAIQAKRGALPLGYLVLIRWAFSELWHILVHLIEYYVSLLQQRADAELVRRELGALFADGVAPATTSIPADFRTITLADLRVRYSTGDDGREFTLTVPQLSIRRGEKLGVMGESGAGKTTLLHTLLNMTPFTGSYTVDGQSVAHTELDPESAAFVGRSDPLFQLSIADNILLGRAIPTELLERVLHGLRISEFAPDLSRRIGDPSVNLSTGQEQRIRLARGIIGSHPLLLLDEPFQGLDRETRGLIMEFLREFLASRTVVMVTHDAEELALVDRTVFIEHGLLSAGGCAGSRPL